MLLYYYCYVLKMLWGNCCWCYHACCAIVQEIWGSMSFSVDIILGDGLKMIQMNYDGVLNRFWKCMLKLVMSLDYVMNVLIYYCIITYD